MADALTQKILHDYPSFAFLINDPQVGKLLRDAVDPNKGFSSQTFFAKLQETSWWKHQSESQRTWAVQNATDPGEANAQRSRFSLSLKNTANAFGMSLNAAQAKWITEVGLSSGWDPSGPEVMDALARTRNGPSRGFGAVGVAAGQIRAVAEGKWFTRPSMDQVTRMAENVALGRDSLESIDQRYSLQARKRYPHLADQLQAGMSLGEIVSPLRDIVANELERQPGDIQIMGHPVWRQLLTGIRDPKSKTVRMMTESEAMRLARAQPAWWKTSNGKKTDAGLGNHLLEVLGMRKAA